MRVTQIAIHRPVTTTMCALALVFLGTVSYTKLPVQRLPDISFPSMYYTVRFAETEMSPEKTNDDITRPFEKMVSVLPGVREMRSSTRSGGFWGYALFEQGTDMRFRVIELQGKVNKWLAAKSEKINVRIIPASTEERSGGLMRLILSVPVGQEFRTAVQTDLIRRKIRSIDGISQVEVAGEMHPNLVLETQRDELLARNYDVVNLITTINKASRDKSWLGSLREGSKTHEVHLKSRIETLDELLKLYLDDEGINRLDSLATPLTKMEDPESIFRFNGKKAVRINISKEKERNTIRMAKRVRAEVEEIRKELPEGFDLTIKRDEAKTLEKLISIIAKLGALGSVLAMLVIFIFVRSWRIALVVAISIPSSIFITFNAMYAAGLSINMLSLLGLAVAVGMLVDNAIVVVENVFRHSQHGGDPLEAAYTGSREVGRAILISTCTNLTVFVPLLFIDDMMVLVIKDIALSFIFPMIVSLGIALTLIPMLTAKVLESTGRSRAMRAKSRREGPLIARRILSADSPRVRWNPWQKPRRLPRKYLKEFVFYCSKGSIRHPIRLFFAVLIFLFATLFVSSIKVAVQGMDIKEKTESITIYGKPPIGSDIHEADRFFLKKEEKVAAEIQESEVFESFESQFTKTDGEIELNVAEKYQNLEPVEFFYAFRNLATRDRDGEEDFSYYPFPQASVETQMSRSMNQKSKLQEGVLVTGESMNSMVRAAKEVREFIEELDNISRVRIETPPGEPEVHYSPDMELFQVMMADPNGLRSFFQSRSEQGVPTNLILEDNEIERRVTVRAISEEDEEEVKQTLSDLRRSELPLLDGGVIPLDNIGSFSVSRGVRNITKKNRQRNLRIGFDFEPNFRRGSTPKQIQDRLKEIQRGLNDMRLPLGVTANMEGTLKEAKESWVTWKKLIGLAVLCLYVVMAFFFESLVAPLVILATLPLAGIGGIWGMIALNTNFGQMAILGSLLLSGLVVNNGILLIEYTRQMERRGVRRPAALMAAVSYRLRPILMTSLTTLLGLLPVLYSEQAKEIHPLIAVLIGGIVTSGLLSLVVVPTLYNTLSLGLEKIQFLPKIIRRKKKAEEAPATASPVPKAIPREMTFFSQPPSTFPPRPFVDPQFGNDLHISVKNVSKIYPTFKMRKLTHFIPPKQFPYGHRPMSGTTALSNVSLDIHSGMFGLLGPNGAGKTTLMKILTGLVEPTYGEVHVAGNDLRFHQHPIRDYISYLPQNFGVYGNLTLDQYLNFFAPFYGLNDGDVRRRRIAEVSELVGLRDVRNKPMKRYSGGMRQRAGIAQIFLSPKPILIVDEPTAGLDPVERVRFRLLLSELARTRIVILSTHIVDDITSSCKRVAVLSHGETIYQGDLEGIRLSATGRIWDVTLGSDQPPPVAPKNILYRKHVGDQILYHYVSSAPAKGSTPVDPSFEDAYISLLLKHEVAEETPTLLKT